MMSKELLTAISAAKSAGEIQKKYFSKQYDVKIKPDNTPVTNVDMKCDEKIISIISKKFPSHSFLTEESGKIKNNETKWIIDPLDGTKEFMRKLPFFGTSIALEHSGKIVIGCIYLPKMDMIMYAEKGKGAFFNGNKVHVSETKKLEDAYIAISNMTTMMKSRHASQAVELSKNVKVCRGFIGLQAFIALANGSIDVYIEAKNHPWDIAASKIIIEEAGGRLTDFDGNDTIYVETALPVTNFFMKK